MDKDSTTWDKVSLIWIRIRSYGIRIADMDKDSIIWDKDSLT